MVAREVAGRSVRSVLVWALGFGAYVAASVAGYASAYKTQASRLALQHSFGNNLGIAAMIGPARNIATVAGFASWRCLGVLSLVGAVWALLAGTRLLRGEEDSGRWELLLAGRTTRRRAATQGLMGLAAGWATLFVVTALFVVGVSGSASPAFTLSASLFFALSLAASAALFLAIAAVAGQLAPTRRQAASVAGGVLGAAYLIRAVADSGTHLEWLRWASPLGWVENLNPLIGSRPLALVPIAVAVAVLVWLAIDLAGRRDLGAATLKDRDTAPERTLLLANPATLVVRLGWKVAAAWVGAVALMGLAYGAIARTAAHALSGSSVEQALQRLGAHEPGTRQMLGLMLLVIAIALTIVAAGQVAATRDEEASGRLDNLLVRPSGRTSWLAGRLGWGTVVLVAGGVLAGILTWVGAGRGGGTPFGSVVAAGLNTVPPALFLLGAGTLVHALAPRWTSAVTYGLIGWSFLVEFLGSVVKFSHWIMDTSLFFHMAPAPASSPNWSSAAGLIGLGCVAAIAAAAVFRRRDLAGA